MIDLHCHLLPGVDDGSRSVAQSVEVLTRMAAGGVTDIVLTPHLEASRVLEGPPPSHDEAFAALTQAAPPGIRLHRGAEVMLDRALTSRAVETRRITLAGSRYVLVEFTGMVAARAASSALEQVVKGGLVPLLAHPERYAACSVSMVTHWRALGARIQVDANTVFRPSGRGRRARALLAAGLVDVLAADNHGDSRSLVEPFRQLEAAGADEVARLTMMSNPEAVLRDVLMAEPATVEVKLPLFDRVRGWFGGSE